MELADLADQGGNGDRVLEQPTDVGVVAGTRAGGAAKLGRDRLAEQTPLDDRSEGRVVDLAAQVLEEALELLGVAIGGRQKAGRIELRLIDRLDLLELGHELAPEALHIAPDANRVAP